MKVKSFIYLKSILLLVFLFIFNASCEDKLPENIDSDNLVVLKSIKILNAGADGAEVIEGIVNEDTKTVWFPRISPDTDLNAIKFEAVMSDGATLDKESYKFEFEEGKDAKTIIVKVVNSPRFREYAVTLRLLVPVYGGDFDKVKIYDYSNSGKEIQQHPSFVSLLTRGSGFDGENVLVVTRASGGSHLLKVDDLKQGTIKPIPLDLSGVSGGTFPVNVGQVIDGHIYITNLSGATGMKTYFWENESSSSELFMNVDPNTIAGAGVRHGDNGSYNLDKNGNGYFYFGDNAVTSIMRYTISNYTTIDDVKILPTQKGASFCMTMLQIEDSEEFLLSGYDSPVHVVNKDATVLYSMSSGSLPAQSSAARIFNFNGERYLIVTTAPRYSGNAVFYLYDITKGNTVIDALVNFEEGDKRPLYQYSIGGGVNAAPSTQTGYHIVKDNDGNDLSLLLYTASADAGFAIMEVPRKELDE